MKYLLLLLSIPFLAASECGQQKDKIAETKTTADSLPACIRKVIDQAEKSPSPDSPVEINEYVYNNKTVYLFTAPCCDQFNVLYDTACNVICAPSGGFTGKGDGKCPDFDKNAKLVKQIWKSKQ